MQKVQSFNDLYIDKAHTALDIFHFAVLSFMASLLWQILSCYCCCCCCFVIVVVDVVVDS